MIDFSNVTVLTDKKYGGQLRKNLYCIMVYGGC